MYMLTEGESKRRVVRASSVDRNRKSADDPFLSNQDSDATQMQAMETPSENWVA